MTVCVDASFPLAFLLGDEEGRAASSRWSDWLRRGEQIVSPPLFRAEVTSAIRLRVFAGRVDVDEGRDALMRSLRWPVQTWDPTEPAVLQIRAYELATRFNRPRAYDTQYLATAEMLSCDLWTADKRLFNAVGHHLPWVRWVGEETG
jgi:predicted nucleic acid-binding protein